jgi:hypothetical protein
MGYLPNRSDNATFPEPLSIPIAIAKDRLLDIQHEKEPVKVENTSTLEPSSSTTVPDKVGRD